jgi:hypothetical protein
MNNTEAVLTVGSGLSNTTKMPCSSFNLSAAHCITGSKLTKIKGSVCFGCYALGGNYSRFKHIEKMKPKTQRLTHPNWVESMVYLITYKNKKDKSFFRWHDSGDVQSLNHLEKIAQVAKLTSHVWHWLPTREYKIVRDYLKKHGNFPENLTVRLSAHMVDQLPPQIPGTVGSAVRDQKAAKGYSCPAPTQGGSCADCRACWNSAVKLVTYKKH